MGLLRQIMELTQRNYFLGSFLTDLLNSFTDSPNPRPSSGSFLPPNKTSKMTAMINNSVDPIDLNNTFHLLLLGFLVGVLKTTLFNNNVVSKSITSGIVKRPKERRSVGGRKAAKMTEKAYATSLCLAIALRLVTLKRMRIVRTTGNWKASPIRADVNKIWERRRLTSKKLPMES